MQILFQIALSGISTLVPDHGGTEVAVKADAGKSSIEAPVVFKGEPHNGLEELPSGASDFVFRVYFETIS